MEALPAVALVGIVVMLVSVFLPPKQIVEETTRTTEIETPTMKTTMPDVALPQMPPIPDGYAGYWVDDDGNRVYVTSRTTR